jgi:hypothetical protein
MNLIVPEKSFKVSGLGVIAFLITVGHYPLIEWSLF